MGVGGGLTGKGKKSDWPGNKKTNKKKKKIVLNPAPDKRKRLNNLPTHRKRSRGSQ